MERVITYLYPKESKASSLKVFQDRTNQIRGFYFTRDNIKLVEELEFADNYSVYFLFDKSLDDFINVYVGQSKNGINRMKTHNKMKDFWSFCIMFTTDNNSFDASTIDYLEYYFINKLNGSGEYILNNKDFRTVEPIVSIYDKPTIKSYISQIEFLLEAEGINLNKTEKEESSAVKYYYPKNQNDRDLGKIYFDEGKFVLVKGSFIRYPKKSSKEWKNKNFYTGKISFINKLIENNKIVEVGEDILKTLVDIPFDAPSPISDLITGGSTNGWEYFDEIKELRE